MIYVYYYLLLDMNGAVWLIYQYIFRRYTFLQQLKNATQDIPGKLLTRIFSAGLHTKWRFY